MGRRGVRFQEDIREWRLPDLLHADDLVLYGVLEEDLRVMVRQFTGVCKRRGLKVNAGIEWREEGLEREVHVDGIHLEDVS